MTLCLAVVSRGSMTPRRLLGCASSSSRAASFASLSLRAPTTPHHQCARKSDAQRTSISQLIISTATSRTQPLRASAVASSPGIKLLYVHSTCQRAAPRLIIRRDVAAFAAVCSSSSSAAAPSDSTAATDAPPPPRKEVIGFVGAAQEALVAGEFVKATLTRYRGKEEHLKSAHLKAVKIKGGVQLQVLFRYKFRDITKNFLLSESRAEMEELFRSGFSMGNLYTTAADWQLVVPKKQSKAASLTKGRAAQTQAPSLDHNRAKNTNVSRDAPFMKALGLVDGNGMPRPDMASKLRQVDHFCEVLGHAVQDSPLASSRRLRVVDMGAGKGYLTFATHAFLSSGGGSGSMELTERQVETIGVEIRQDMVDHTNSIARESPGCEGLRFEKGSIAGWSRDQGVASSSRRPNSSGPEQGQEEQQETDGSAEVVDKVDILIALHACDTATDDALFYGINAGADVIVASPCCHKEDVLRHGILAERQAELVTDALRASLLEAAGYKASVFEFVTGEHTSKNLMICAVKRGSRDEAAQSLAEARAAELLEQFGIGHQRLAALTGIGPPQEQHRHQPLVSFD